MSNRPSFALQLGRTGAALTQTDAVTHWTPRRKVFQDQEHSFLAIEVRKKKKRCLVIYFYLFLGFFREFVG
jgi:hypothetical protein